MVVADGQTVVKAVTTSTVEVVNGTALPVLVSVHGQLVIVRVVA